MPSQSPGPTALTQTFTYPPSSPLPFRIRYTRLGPSDGIPVIFIHGTPWSSRLWAPFALALSHTGHSVYLFDNPGYGESPAPEASAEYDITKDGGLWMQTEVFAALFAEWGFPIAGGGKQEQGSGGTRGKKPHVIAHDNAGLCALRANIEHGCEYASLLLVDVVAVGPWGLDFFKLVNTNQGVLEALPGNMFEGIVRGYIKPGAFKPLKEEVEDDLVGWWVTKEGQKAKGPGQAGFVKVFAQASGRVTEDVEERYKEVVQKGVKVKVVWGKEDRWVPVERGEKLREKLGGETKLVVVEEAGHLIQLDQPERLMVEILTFIQEAGSPNTSQ
ncbi:uncharacterized protein KY384_000299 [Bacidia gigantensis]|uniref:uncharacterized protein n=1 Tax=Bacidia gigantensis TaxID=2732470 RepID=UPI001D059948|nr:uncharacterized protein KY384_000299 [Bacidia gigantensis]KAG8526306.1 hypothetical protein KY384_000299 [Bacidia gigantensis]